ncbi:response regulator [Pelagerythrobacter aerophilus]|jgi:DNA-binding NarL/FixJ family response regulator|uniref:DNA-binding response regulator n=1 Tax=Pelagerythrobacter aerophilus TaxID=2306995 RepID=A0A418NKH1_9SPHN|nr:response regulator transcription factor [Pelagerythrobacter aerophilus]RIV79953.1 DNA-binding response regulator [Pelagerythrobacter aerophilus]
MTPVPRILIVDDHQLAREGLKAVLDGEDAKVVGMASTGEESVAMTAKLEPDIVLMDVRLGAGIDGLEATRRIAALGLGARVIMLTLHEMPAYVREALAAGAAGYVVKDTAIEDLRAAIAQVMAGRSALPLDLVGAAMRATTVTPKTLDPAEILTPREQDVLDLIAEGLTNKGIARKLEISPATVKVHVERIIGKLGVADRTQAAVVAAKASPAVD